MLIPIILVLLWVVPVVIHAVVVSRRKHSLWKQVAFYKGRPTLKTKAGEAPILYATGVDPYYDGGKRGPRFIDDEAGSWQSNFAIVIPTKAYYPNAHWRTHHGMIDLHRERMRRKDINYIQDKRNFDKAIESISRSGVPGDSQRPYDMLIDPDERKLFEDFIYKPTDDGGKE